MTDTNTATATAAPNAAAPAAQPAAAPAAAQPASTVPTNTPTGVSLGINVNVPEAAVAAAATAARIDKTALEREVAQGGKFTDTTLAVLRANGMSEDAIGLTQETVLQRVQARGADTLNVLGGRERATRMEAWATKVTDPGTLAVLTDIREKLASPDDAIRREAAARLATQYAQATGDDGPNRQIDGFVAPRQDANPLPPIRSAADLAALEKDPRYKRDHPEHRAFKLQMDERVLQWRQWTHSAEITR